MLPLILPLILTRYNGQFMQDQAPALSKNLGKDFGI